MALEPFIIEWKKQQERQRRERETRIPLRLPLPLTLPPLKESSDNDIIPLIPSYDMNYDISSDDKSPRIEEEGGLIYIPLHNNDISSLYKV